MSEITIAGNDIRMLRQVTLRLERCHACGIHWAVENGRAWDRCPRCAGEKVQEQYAEVERLKRVVAGLRGALGRRRRA